MTILKESIYSDLRSVALQIAPQMLRILLYVCNSLFFSRIFMSTKMAREKKLMGQRQLW